MKICLNGLLKTNKTVLFRLIFLFGAFVSVRVALAEDEAVFLIKAFKVFFVKSLADFFHKVIIEIEVMKNAKAHAERFFCFYKVSYIRS